MKLVAKWFVFNSFIGCCIVCMYAITDIHIYSRKYFLHFRLQQNHEDINEKYKLIELAAKLQELMLNN